MLEFTKILITSIQNFDYYEVEVDSCMNRFFLTSMFIFHFTDISFLKIFTGTHLFL